MRVIKELPPRIWELIEKYNIKTTYKSGVMTEDQRKYIVDQILAIKEARK